MERYAAYKDSGVEWIREIPEGWEVKRFKYLFDLITDKVEEELPKIGLENVESQTGALIETNSDFDGDGIHFISGDILFGKLRPYLAKVYLSSFQGKAVGDFFVFRSKGEIYPGFGSKLILSKRFIEIVNGSTFGSKMPRVSWDFIANLRVAYPAINEQTAIANYLDLKTAEIDALIAQKQRLIELYQEEKTAIVNQAVTQGIGSGVGVPLVGTLNNNGADRGNHKGLPLRDSGIDWLGQIPNGWEVAELRRFISFITSGSRGWAEHYADQGKIFVRIGNLTRHSIDVDLSDIQYVDPPAGAEGERTKIREGDVLFSITAYIGSVAIATDEIAGAYINQHIAMVRPIVDRVFPKYVAYVALSDIGQSQLSGQGYGGTKIQLALDDVKSLLIPVPPLSEQTAIVHHIETESARIDAKIAKTQRIIELQKEYRNALISEVVTGKIKVTP